MKRYAIKFAYDGAGFSGSQRQPGLRTVEGDLLEALASSGAVRAPSDSGFSCASRTDSGVSALGNVAVFSSDIDARGVLPGLNRRLEDIWVHGIAEVSSDFEPRHASRRWYRYHMEWTRDLDAASLRETAGSFVGTHDFSSFARVEEGRNPVRKMDSIEVTESGGMLLMDFTARGFLWGMVRRVASAMVRMARGELDVTDVDDALGGGRVLDAGAVPPDGLVLMDVEYEGLAFSGSGLSRLHQDVSRRLSKARVITLLLRDLAGKLEGDTRPER